MTAGSCVSRPPLRARIAGTLSHELHVGPPASVWVQTGLILVASLIFGFQFVAFKEGFDAAGPWTLLAIRPMLSIPVMLLVMRWASVPIAAGRGELARIALPATLMVASHAAFMVGLHRLPAGLTSTLVSMTPLVSVALGLLFRVERVAAAGLVGAVAGVAGVAIATGAGTGGVDVLGVALILSCNVIYCLSFISMKRMATRVSSAIYLIVMMVLSIAVFVPVAALSEGFAVTWSWRPLLAIAYLVVFGQVIAYLAVLGLLRTAGVFQSSLVTPLIPVFGILFAVLLLGEPLLGRELGGGALIIGGVLVAITPRERLRRLNTLARRGSISP